MRIPKEFILNEKKILLREELCHIHGNKIFVVMDFDRNFDAPDFDALPGAICVANSLPEEYLIQKYNIILGEVAYVHDENEGTL